MKGKIVFVHPPLSIIKRYGKLAQAGFTDPPNGLCCLASIARKEGYDTSIIDAEALKLNPDDTVKLVLNENPDYVGITATTQLIISAGLLADKIKQQNKNIKIIVGGTHITALPEQSIRENLSFDIGVIGEGEVTLVELLKALSENRDLHEINGLIYLDRKSGNIVRTPNRKPLMNLDDLPFPALDLLPNISKYYRPTTQAVDRLPALSLVTSRGCPGQCTFCDTSVHGHLIRMHSAKYVVELLNHISKKYGIKSVFFADDNFLISKSRLREFVKLKKEKKVDITWSCMARVDVIDDETLKLAKEGGCWQINYGIETADQNILNFYKKNINPTIVREAIEMTKKYKIKVKGYIMIGNPMETRESLEKTLSFVLGLKLDDVSIGLFTPYPGSSIYDNIEKYGRFIKNWEKMSCYEVVFIPTGFTEKEIWHYARLTYRKFYLRPRIIISYLQRIRSWSQFKVLFSSGITLLKYIFNTDTMDKIQE